MFPGSGWSFNGLKHLTEKVTAVASLTRVQVVVDHTMATVTFMSEVKSEYLNL